MKDMIWYKGKESTPELQGFTTNLPKAKAPEDPIKNHLLNTTSKDKV